jgi:hypothetical protein
MPRSHPRGTCDTTRTAQLDALHIGNYHRPRLEHADGASPDMTVPLETALNLPDHAQCYRPALA